MKKLKKIRGYLLVAILISLICIPISIFAAGSTTFSFSGNGNVNTNEEFTVEFVVNTSDSLKAVNGTVSVDNSSCVNIKSVTAVNVDSTSVNNNKFVYTSMNGLNGTRSLLKITLVAGSSNCTTNLKVSGIKAGFAAESNDIVNLTVNKSIKVGESTQSSDATLKSLKPSTGSLSPAFSPSVTSYEMSVGKDTNTITFTGVPSDSGAKVISGSTCNLSSSTTTCKIVVKAEDGKTKEYSVVVKKDSGNTDTPTPSLSDDATLKSLNVSGYTLTPKFNKNTTVYSMNVGSNITGLKVTAVPTDSNAKVTVTGNSNWKEGVNTIRITVTAPSGAEKIYTVNVTKKGTGNTTTTTTKSSDNFLKSLSVSNGEISPKFDKNNNSYSLEVSSDVNKLDLSAVASDSKSKVNITGNENLKVGNNIINIEVQAEDGSIRIYTLNVTKSDKSSNNKLSDIIVKDYPIDFEKDKYEYDITVPSDVDELKIDVTKENKNSKVEITGNKNLKEGNNTVLIKVTDENGFTQYYKLNVQKEADDGKFLGLSLSNWLLLLGLLLLTLMFVLILFLIFKKKKDDEEETPVAAPTNNPNPTPIIEFKPEFNFGSKNGTDDDIVEEGGVLNQYTGIPPKKDEKEVKEIDYIDAKLEEIPYDPYDDKVTKDELFDALHESIEKKDVRKLKMLYEQEKLNREKEEIRKSYEDEDDE